VEESRSFLTWDKTWKDREMEGEVEVILGRRKVGSKITGKRDGE
jgi:hypothetical protein